MSLKKHFWEFVLKVATEKLNLPLQTIAGESNTALPISTGRSSVPTHKNSFAPGTQLEEIPLDFAADWFTTLEHLAAYNSDFGFAVDNIVQMSNTPHDIFFRDDVPDSQVKEMKAFLKESEKGWYNYSSGIHSLKADLLSQVAINGSLSAEIIPGANRGRVPDHVKQVVRVSPKYIRFLYNREKDTYLPYQRPVTTLFDRRSSYDLIELNPNQYSYIAWRRFHDSPYATPPFLAAVEGLTIQRDMINNFKNIMEKLGMLGFLTAEVTPPSKNRGESDNDYFNRCVKYLEDVVYPQLDKNISKGIVAGFKDSHEFNLQGNNMNVNGAEKLMQIVELNIFSGVKQDPNVLGRNFSTTETFGRVILAKMVSQTKEYQKIVDAFFSKLYYMALRLEGFSPGYVEVQSNPSMAIDKKKEEETNKHTIDNTLKKRNAGIISQQQAANELGYDEPAEEDFVRPGNSDQPDGDDDSDRDTADPGEEDREEDEQQSQSATIEDLEFKLGQGVPEYEYGDSCCGHCVGETNFESFADFRDPKVRKLNKAYFDQTHKRYKQAVGKAVKNITDKLSNFDQSAPVEHIQEMVYVQLLLAIDNHFAATQDEVSGKHVRKIYRQFRRDKSVFQQSFSGSFQDDDFEIPEAVLTLNDFRAIEYLSNSDPLYMGKFITDSDIKNKVFEYIRKNYFDNTLPIGRNKQFIDKFKKEFGELVNLAAWKIRRVIDTTVNKARNFARVFYMDQARVVEYSVVEVIDNLTCEYCKVMNGKTFTVQAAKTRVIKEVNGGPENIRETSPILTNEKIDDVRTWTSKELSAKGYLVPVFHPHCRGRTVARIPG